MVVPESSGLPASPRPFLITLFVLFPFGRLFSISLTVVGSWVLPIWWSGTLFLLTVKQVMDAAQASDDKSNLAMNGVEVSTVQILLLSAVLIGF